MLFQHFCRALELVENQDSQILSWQKPKMAFCHRLAMHLQQRMPEFFTDLQPTLPGKGQPACDILVHTRTQDDYRPMAINCKADYFSQKEQDALITLGTNPDTLALGIAFFPKKDYFLIYRALQDRLEYYHFDRLTLFCQPLRSKDIPGTKEAQLQYSLKLPRVKPLPPAPDDQNRPQPEEADPTVPAETTKEEN